MKKNWIRLLTMLLAAMLILTMSGVVSLANDEPVTGDGVSDVSSDTNSPVETGENDEEPSEDASSTDTSSEDVSSEDTSSTDTSSEDTGSTDAGPADDEPAEAVQAVIDLIDALPGVDEIKNFNPEVDLPEGDEGYDDAYHEAYAAYIEEAKEKYAAAQEAYDALTDEEKAEIPEELSGKLAGFAGFIAMLGQVDTLELDAANGGPEYYPEFGTKKVPFFFANGTPITITEASTDGMGAKITWNGGEQEVPANTNVFGGYHNNETSCETSITMTGGQLNAVFGGGLHASHVTKAEVTISGGSIPSQVAGGGASSLTKDCSADCPYTDVWYSGDAESSPCRVDETVVNISGGTNYFLVYGGGEGISSTGTATLNISGGGMSGAYVTAGGSNGFTGSGTVNVSGSADIKVLQGVNRGSMNNITLNVTGGQVASMYAGGQTDDDDVTGTFTKSTVSITGGKVTDLYPGSNGTAGTNVAPDSDAIKLDYTDECVTNPHRELFYTVSLTTRAELRYRYSYDGSFGDWSEPVTQFSESGGFESAKVAVDRAGGETFTLQYQLKSADPGKTLEFSPPEAVTVQTNAGIHVLPLTEKGEGIYQVQVPMSVLKEECDDYSSIIMSLAFKEDGGGQTGQLIFSFKVGAYAGEKADYKPYAGIYGSASGDMIFLWEDGTAIKGAEAVSTAKTEIAHLADGTVQLKIFTYSKNYTYLYDAQNSTLTDLENGQNVYAKVAALTTSGDRDTIKLLGNITVVKSIVIPEEKDIILDMNGKSVTVGSSFTGRPVINYGTLTVTGNGTIDSSASEFGGYGAIDNYGTLTITNGTFRGSVYADGSSVKNRPSGTVTINGGTFEKATGAFYNEGTATVNGGTFTSTSCTDLKDSNEGDGHWAYALNSSGTLYFNNGTVQGVQGALSISSGYAEVKDGHFETVADPDGKDACAHYAIYIAGESGEVEAHVSGGTFKSASKVALYVGNDNTGGDGGINAKATAYITGGTFIGGGNGTALHSGANTGNPSISGGIFSSEIDAKYLAAGYQCVAQEGQYHVIADVDTKVEIVGGGRYKTFAEALAAAKDGDVIQIISDLTAEGNFSIQKDVTVRAADGVKATFTGMVSTNGKVELESLNFISHNIAIYPSGGSLSVKSCTFGKAGEEFFSAVYNESSSVDSISFVHNTLNGSYRKGLLTHAKTTVVTGNLFNGGGKSYSGEANKTSAITVVAAAGVSTTIKENTFSNYYKILSVDYSTAQGVWKIAQNKFLGVDYAFELTTEKAFNYNLGYNYFEKNGAGVLPAVLDAKTDTAYTGELVGPYPYYVDAAMTKLVYRDTDTRVQIEKAITEAEKVLTGTLADKTLTELAGRDLTADEVIALKSGKDCFKAALEILNAIDPDDLQYVLDRDSGLKEKVDAIRTLSEVAFAITEEAVEAKTDVKEVTPPPADTADLSEEAAKKLTDEVKAKTDSLKSTVETQVTSNEAAKKAPEGLKEAVKLDTLTVPENTKEVKLTVVPTLTAIEAGADVDKTDKENPSADVYPTTLVFEVVPQATYVPENGPETTEILGNHQISGVITFRLPIPSSVTDKYARIVHVFSDGSGSEILYPEIEEENGHKFVEVKVSKFSVFTVTFTNNKPSGGGHSSGGSGGSGGGSASLDNYEFWAKVQRSIERADSGDVIKASASKALNVPGSVLRALEGRDVTLVISYKGREIAIYGKNMPSIPDNKVFYTFDDLFDLFEDYDATVAEIPAAKPGNPVTGGGYYLPGVTVPTVTFTAELPEVPAAPETISLEPAEKAVEPAVPAEAAPAQTSAPAAAHRHLSGVTIALAALIAAVAVGGITTGVWLYKRREQE